MRYAAARERTSCFPPGPVVPRVAGVRGGFYDYLQQQRQPRPDSMPPCARICAHDPSRQPRELRAAAVGARAARLCPCQGHWARGALDGEEGLVACARAASP